MASSKSSRDDVRRLILLILAGYTVLAIGFLQWYFTRNGQHPVWVLILGAVPTVALVVYGVRYLRARRASAPRPE